MALGAGPGTGLLQGESREDQGNPSVRREPSASDLTDDRALEQELLRLIGIGGRDPPSERAPRGRTITVKIRDGDFRTRQASHTLPDPVESDATIFSVAREPLQGTPEEAKGRGPSPGGGDFLPGGGGWPSPT